MHSTKTSFNIAYCGTLFLPRRGKLRTLLQFQALYSPVFNWLQNWCGTLFLPRKGKLRTFLQFQALYSPAFNWLQNWPKKMTCDEFLYHTTFFFPPIRFLLYEEQVFRLKSYQQMTKVPASKEKVKVFMRVRTMDRLA